MDNGAYGGAPYRLPEKFGLADTIGRKPRSEVGVFIFGQPGFHKDVYKRQGLDKSGGMVDALDSAEYSGSLIILLNDCLLYTSG